MMNKRKGSWDFSLPSLLMAEPAAAAQDGRRIDVPTQRCGPDHSGAPEACCVTPEDPDDV